MSTEYTDDYYAKLLEDIQADSTPIDPAAVDHTPGAGAADLINATGTSSIEEFHQVAYGRPRLGEDRRPAPRLGTRVPVEMKQKVQALAKQRGLHESEVVFEALNAYLKNVA
ncbi:ribbon-helix-helix domain-containing protein [Rothia sp. AR01]|uniref:Ribbon-helix-helix domain-containing protein n=1 Tax=Rothia santali TaxID=2949643 RepID=A0A9X2HJ04_9MICC|nr:ribbon-helix-helix domain-containing protein [Rothia santali]MCP3425143.1 ribbon-helix-helix domain-containing protein [Rothia santali]